MERAGKRGAEADVLQPIFRPSAGEIFSLEWHFYGTVKNLILQSETSLFGG
jgi:hypothetical protein